MHGLSGAARSTILSYLTAGALLFLVGVAVSYQYDFRVRIERRTNRLNDTLVYIPRYAPESGPQLVMIYAGSSTCPWSNVPDLPDAVETIKRRLAIYASEHGLSFKALGIALDWSPERGLEHLAKFGFFDEMSAGYSWGNSLAIQYLRSNGSTPAATPMIVVYQRTLVAPSDTGGAVVYEVRNRRTLLVKRGAQEIAEWAQSGAPVEGVDLAAR